MADFSLLVLFLMMIAQVIIPPIPAEIIVIAAASKYGIVITALVSGTGLFIGSVLVYFFGKHYSKRFNKFFNHKKLKKIKRILRKYQFSILWVRILPYNPSDIISYGAGLLAFRKKPFMIISIVTSYARCFLLASLGSMITSWGSLLMVAGLLILSAIAAYSLMYQK